MHVSGMVNVCHASPTHALPSHDRSGLATAPSRCLFAARCLMSVVTIDKNVADVARVVQTRAELGCREMVTEHHDGVQRVKKADVKANQNGAIWEQMRVA